jgi:hypothetical protein
MATATPSTTPNPNAMKYTLDITLPATINAMSETEASTPFLQAVFAAGGVASVFGVNNFVTVTRSANGDWDRITEAVQAAASTLA